MGMQTQQGLTPAHAPARSMAVPAVGQPLLALEHITKHFGATVALDDVSLEFFPGEIHCVLGENGAGKSTIGKVMAGIHAPDAGVVRVRGEPVRFADVNASRACGLAMVYQELSLAPDLSVRANLKLGSRHKGQPFSLLKHREEMAETRAVLERLGCHVDLEEPVRNLPVATQQMVEIAKALLQEPALIILDEPTAMLGAAEKQALFDVLRGLRNDGKALVLITHHIDDVMALADRVTVMRNGQCVDSFPMDGSFDGETVLERLTGKRQILSESRPAPASREDTVLRIENAPWRDGSRGTVRVRRGEIVGLYGVAGCGAEGLIRSLVGLWREQGARFLLNGQPYVPSSPAASLMAGVSYLPAGRAQNGIFPSLSIRENLSLTMVSRFGTLGVVSQRAEVEDARERLGRFSVKYHDIEDGIESLSGGNQQKVLMARAMARATHMLILEEPTAGIDINAKLSIHEHIRALAAQGVGVLILSSDLLETVQLCQSVYTFYGNEIVRCYEQPSMADQPAIVADVLGQSATH